MRRITSSEILPSRRSPTRAPRGCTRSLRVQSLPGRIGFGRPLTQTVTPEEAAARLEPDDSLGIPLGTGQPGALLEALGQRDDWDGLRIYGALLFVYSPVFEHPKVHYLSGFLGPVERMLRDKGATSASPRPTSAASSPCSQSNSQG